MVNGKIKLIALDMDGTLLNDNNNIPQANADAIWMALNNNIKVVLVSARPVCAMLPYYKMLRLEEMPMAALCGACIISHDSVLFEKTIPAEIYQKIFALFDCNKAYIKIYGKNRLYVNKDIIETKNYSEKFGVPYKLIDCNMAGAINENIYRIYIPDISDKNNKLDKIKALGMNYANLLESGIEIMPDSINKGNAVRFLSQKYGFMPDNVMAIGNEGSDITMLEFAGTGIAVGNAIDDLKTIAAAVVDSNNRAGVAEAIYRYCL